MSHPLTNPVHKFYIPVMGTGYSVDTPIRVAKYGISSVISIVDDFLLEKVRAHYNHPAVFVIWAVIPASVEMAVVVVGI